MKFRTTMLLAALLATAGCGGDDDSSGLLSPTAPSLGNRGRSPKRQLDVRATRRSTEPV